MYVMYLLCNLCNGDSIHQMKDPLLLPSILPNVFSVSSTLDATQFQELVLPSLKPLFALRDPPQNMIVLLENLGELQQKTSKPAFRQGDGGTNISILDVS
jgi:SCY1-like protein 2